MNADTNREFTEVWTGVDLIVAKSLAVLARIKTCYDLCLDSTGPQVILSNSTMRDAYKSLIQRGVKVRMITEITKDNLIMVPEMSQMAEIRHLDGVVGNFVIADQSDYACGPQTDNMSVSKLIVSNIRPFVRQQQFFFELLWQKAIPADQRISELENGMKPRIIQIIHDTHDSIGRAFEIMKNVKSRYSVLFASARTFVIAAKAGAMDAYLEMAKRGVKIRILVPSETTDESVTSSLLLHKQLVDSTPDIELKISEANIKSKISFLVSDMNEVITWELKDDTIEDPYTAGGVAVYSNIPALAVSYSTIFDNLWQVTELTDTLRTANIRLEDNQKAMTEFINVAAHELRTPLQPILGLAELLRGSAKSKDSLDVPLNAGNTESGHGSGVTDKLSQQELLEVIIRNAHRLGILSDEILDVARIEGGRMKLRKERIDIESLVLKVINDLKLALPFVNNSPIADRLASPSRITGGVQVFYKKEQDDSIVVSADPSRISQVLSNLITNALKFTKDGAISVTIERGDVIHDGKRRTDEIEDEVVVTVSDTGTGIDTDILPRLFEKFATKSDRGTGLGLFISKGIIEAHGGRIWGLNNENGKGAAFTFTIPI